MHQKLKIICIVFIVLCLIYITIKKPEYIEDIRQIRPFLMEFKHELNIFTGILEEAHSNKNFGQLAYGVNDFYIYMRKNADKFKRLFVVMMALFVVAGNVFMEIMNYIQRHKLLLFLFALVVFASVDVSEIPSYVRQFFIVKI